MVWPLLGCLWHLPPFFLMLCTLGTWLSVWSSLSVLLSPVTTIYHDTLAIVWKLDLCENKAVPTPTQNKNKTPDLIACAHVRSVNIPNISSTGLEHSWKFSNLLLWATTSWVLHTAAALSLTWILHSCCYQNVFLIWRAWLNHYVLAEAFLDLLTRFSSPAGCSLSRCNTSFLH